MQVYIYILISRKRNPIQPPSFLVNGSTLEQVSCYKYLGILITADLLWSSHIQAICSRAKRLLGLLYRRFYNHLDPPALLQLYTTLVRPVLEYAAPVWDPYLLKDIKQLEDVQKFAFRLCMKSWGGNYDNLLHQAQMPTLKNRRNYLKVSTLFKILSGTHYFPPDNYY